MYNVYDTKAARKKDNDTILAEIHAQAEAEAVAAEERGDASSAARFRDYIEQSTSWIDTEEEADNDGKFVMQRPPERIRQKVTLKNTGQRYSRERLHKKTISLDEYKLTIPVDKDGLYDGKAVTIFQPELLTYSDEWFAPQADGSYIFRCPDGGAIMGTSSYSRSELRHLPEFTAGDDVKAESNFKLVTKLSDFVADKSLHVSQLHGGSTPWLKLAYKKSGRTGKTYLKAFVKDGKNAEQSIRMLEVTKDSELFNVIIHYYRDTLAITVNGVVLVTQPMYWTEGTAYFKRGAYYGNKDGNGDIVTVMHS